MPSTVADPSTRQPNDPRNKTKSHDVREIATFWLSFSVALSAAALICVLLLAFTLYTGFWAPAAQHQKELDRKIKILEQKLEVQADTISGMGNRLTESENPQPQPAAHPGQGRTPDTNGSPRKALDPAVAWLQEIGSGFLVGHLSLEQVAGGVRFKGRIVNSTCLEHRNARFKLSANDKSQEILAPALAAGGSANFETVVQGVTKENAKPLRLEYIESSISYDSPDSPRETR